MSQGESKQAITKGVGPPCETRRMKGNTNPPVKTNNGDMCTHPHFKGKFEGKQVIYLPILPFVQLQQPNERLFKVVLCKHSSN